MEIYRCQYCSERFSAPSEQLLDRHIKLVHSQDPSFIIQCKHEPCSRTFTNYRTYLLKHKLPSTAPSYDGVGVDSEVEYGFQNTDQFTDLSKDSATLPLPN